MKVKNLIEQFRNMDENLFVEIEGLNKELEIESIRIKTCLEKGFWRRVINKPKTISVCIIKIRNKQYVEDFSFLAGG